MSATGTLQLPSFASQNGYTVIARHKMDWGKFTDSNHIYQALGQQPFIDHLGLVTPFNQYGLVNTPILNMINVKKSTLYLDNIEGKFRFSMPYKRGLPYVVDTFYTNTIEKPGLDGARFKIKLSEPYANGDVISTDLRNSPSLVVTEEEVVYEQDGYVHVVEVASQDRKRTYYSKRWLKPGSQFIKIDHAIDEYSAQGSSITSQRLGWLELEANLGSGEKRVEHWITLHGSLMALAADDKLKSKLNQSYDLEKLGSVLAFFNKDAKGKRIPGSGSWLATMDAMVLAELMSMQEMSFMWGKGGEARVSGRKNVKLSLGMYEQLRTGNRLTYSRGKLNLSLLDSAIANLYRGTGIPVEDRRTTLDVGSGFLLEISKLIQLEATSKNIGIINSDQLGIVSGKDPMNLTFGFRFTSLRFPNAGLVNFRLNPALDTEYGLRNTDRLYGEFPDYSYSAMILDVTDARSTNAAQKFEKNDIRNATDWNKDSNVYLVKPRAASEDYWGYVAGSVSPYGLSRTKGGLHASTRPGYGMFAYNFGNVWIKDPSRTLLIEIDHTF
jgi:hypothetical protein